MKGLLRKLLIHICIPIYELIPKIYDIFFKLANGNDIFGNEMIDNISSNIYVLVSVVLLFAFSVNILAAIVNPELLNDKKKGIGAMFKRTFIGIALIVIVPFLFDEAYKIQAQVMSNNLIEKLVVGINYDENGGNGGQVIAGTLISSVLYPQEDNIKVSENISDKYNSMVAKNIEDIEYVADHINIAPSDDVNYEYAFKFEGLVALLAGGVTCYILLLFAMDMAVRVFKLLFLELTAPISIVAYMSLGDDYLKKWFTEVGKTYGQVFVKIVCMAFYLFLISNLYDFLDKLSGADNFFLKVLLIVGMLIFVKQAPDFISRIFGIEFKPKGGIGGRLGEMAAVGNIAQNAWKKVRNPIAAAAGIGSAVGGTVSHAVGTLRSAAQNGRRNAERLRDNAHTGLGRGLGYARGVLGGIGQGLVGMASTPLSTLRSLRNGVNNRNLHSIHDEYQNYRDTHREGSSFIGRTIDDIRSGTGFRTRDEAYTNTNENLQKSLEAINKVTSAASSFLQSEDCTIQANINGVNGNYHQLLNHLQMLQNSAPVASDFRDAAGNLDMAAYNNAMQAHTNNVNNFAGQLNDFLRNGVNQVINDRNGLAAHMVNNDALVYSTSNAINEALRDYNSSSRHIDGLDNINLNLVNIAADFRTQSAAANRIQGERNVTRDARGNLNEHGRQHADQQSRESRPRHNNNQNNNNNNT